MSTATAQYGAILDVSNTSRVPLTRLIKVELRKMVDTRAGMWLMIVAGAISAVVVTIVGFVGNDSDRTFGSFLALTAIPQAYLLPILGTLLITQEWGQRTAMVTFTLEPHRGRVAAAKVVAALLIGLASLTVATVAAASATLLFGGSWSDLTLADFAGVALFESMKILMGLIFGLLFLNSAGAIVASLLLPVAFSVIANVWSLLHDKAPWIDLSTAMSVLVDGGPPTSTEWAQLLVTSLIWLVIPFAVGIWRMLNAELK